MPKARDVAAYIIKTIPVDPLKLQKLLYYTQAVSLVKHKKPAFDDVIEAWDYGPVVREIYDTYKKYGFDDIKKAVGSAEALDVDTINSADMVIEYYGAKSGPALINETHSEAPWQEAYKKGQNTPIAPDAMKKYYKKIFSFT